MWNGEKGYSSLCNDFKEGVPNFLSQINGNLWNLFSNAESAANIRKAAVVTESLKVPLFAVPTDREKVIEPLISKFLTQYPLI